MELTRQHFRIMIYYDFKKGLSAYDCEEGLKLTFADQASSLPTIYRWYKEFKRGRTTVEHQKGAGPSITAVTEENIAAVKKIMEVDNRTSCAVREAHL